MAFVVRVKFASSPKIYDYFAPPTIPNDRPAVGDYVVINTCMKTNNDTGAWGKWEDLKPTAKLAGFGIAEVVAILDSEVDLHHAQKMYIGHITQARMVQLDKRRHLAAKAAKEAEEAAAAKKQREAKIAGLKLELGERLVAVALKGHCTWAEQTHIETIKQQIKELSNER
jgi:hypothetical protein